MENFILGVYDYSGTKNFYELIKQNQPKTFSEMAPKKLSSKLKMDLNWHSVAQN